MDSRGVSSPFSASITVEVPPPSQLGTDVTPPSTPIGSDGRVVRRETGLPELATQHRRPGRTDLTYKVFRNTVLIGTSTAASFVDTAPAAGKYSYTVRASTRRQQEREVSSGKGYASTDRPETVDGGLRGRSLDRGSR